MKYSKNVFRSLAMITQFGINMLVPICICSFVGIYLDKRFGTSFWMILLFFIGALAGFRNIFIFARRIYSKTDKVRKGRSGESEHAETTESSK